MEIIQLGLDIVLFQYCVVSWVQVLHINLVNTAKFVDDVRFDLMHAGSLESRKEV